ncbi:NADPH:quinone oxidoreductase [Dorcoceras hygrometricum]|uniref:NADPH:quinone oxidoreductase n=1 Tax=Dorcoceras hygrometricum TaxID=472368 RepID=A0A2Z7A6N3_9LAMI|nr:NADPH:quinone oxidoreductase [Dorcoceras hygrometricum]
MPRRRRGRATRQIPAESEDQNEEIQRSAPVRRSAWQVDDEVDVLAARVDEMELIMVRFQHMNPQTFVGDESSYDAVSWLQHIT